MAVCRIKMAGDTQLFHLPLDLHMRVAIKDYFVFLGQWYTDIPTRGINRNISAFQQRKERIKMFQLANKIFC